MDVYVGNIIALAREETGETDFSSGNGIQQSVLVEALNDAQIHCQSELIAAYPKIFDVTTIINSVTNQGSYELPTSSYLGGSILYVGYSPNGLEDGYYELSNNTARFAVGETSQYPARWIPGAPGTVTINPAPSTATGKIKVIHALRAAPVDLRRGTIVADPVLSGDMVNYVSIQFATDTYLDLDTLAANDYICVNSVDGEIKYSNIRYNYSTGYDANTKTLTFFAPVPVASGLIELGDYVTCGKWTTTHSSLDDICKPILRAFVNRRLYLGKSSSDVDAENQNIQVFTTAMLKAYRKRDRGPKKWPYTGKFE